MSNKNDTPRSNSSHGHGPAATRPVEKAKDFKGTLKKLLSSLNEFKLQIAAVVIFVITSVILSIISPKLLGRITNQVTDDYMAIKVYDGVHDSLPEGVTLPAGTTLEDLLKQREASSQASSAQSSSNSQSIQQLADNLTDSQRDRLMSLDLTKRPGISFDIIGQIALLLIAIYLFSALFNYVESWIVTSITQRVAYRFRRDLSQKINHMPLRYFDTHPFGDVLSRITNDVDMVSQNLSQVISQVVYCTATIIGILAMMISISLTMTAIVLITIPF